MPFSYFVFGLGIASGYIDVDSPLVIDCIAWMVAAQLIGFLWQLFLKLLYRLGLKRFSHYMLAMECPYDIWLLDKCPYESCKDCKAWTCPAYDKYHHHLCKGKK